jgi:hypothetical protein
MPNKPNTSDRSSMKPDLPGRPPVTPMPSPCNPVANPSLADCPDQRSQPRKTPNPRQDADETRGPKERPSHRQ